ncbi:hypothetical protein HNO88_003005 [Novosphingobium chloroacetimidivorans]|uniref:Uncharacterized protein n=1 Tax=Novosphingobium chloroacetimidivorans TaxID=1428314 RepID=A0A7W7KBE0_9SPHN|nr:hypothetical protein [Novosphingobium chloroacetimidivorans]MBB4859676.1 hypothetical protein [Novosphingobium chloroacetimidivorans]
MAERPRIRSDPSRIAMIEATQAEYRRLAELLAPHMVRIEDPEMRAVNVAQNVLRDAVTVVMNEMIPYTHTTVLELAFRLASYALSAAPLEDQDEIVAAFVSNFADVHLQRTSQGQVITSEWRMHDGREMPNFPKEGDHA